jgi:hypothetical protein
MTRRVMCAAVIGLIATLPLGSISAQTSGEFWPELDVYWNVTSRYRLFSLTRLLYRSPESQSRVQYGLHLDDMGLFRNGFVRVGYRFIPTFKDPANAENRGIVEATVHGRGATRFVNRVRSDLRYLDDEFSVRLRDRVRIEHQVRVSGRVIFLPYTTAEAFYDSRYGGLARMRYQAGSEMHPTKNVGVDLLYVRQDNYRSTRSAVNAFMAKLMLTF